MTKVSKILAAIILFGFNVSYLQAQIIKNGSFESASVNPGSRWLGLPNGSKAITGWTVTGGNIEYVGIYWMASDSIRSVDLNGGTTGAISHSFKTFKDSVYQVQFDMAGNPDGGPTVKRMRVSAADSSREFTFSIAGKSRQNMRWQNMAFEFTAIDTLTTLTFTSLVSGAYGAVIDNVSASLRSSPGKGIRVGILYSSLPSDSIFWRNLNSNWSQYGTTGLQIDYTSMIHDSVTYDSLNYHNFDVIVIDNALSQPPNPPIYADNEIAAIKRYVQEGHGLIVTGCSFRGNASLAPLLGYSLDVGGQVCHQTGITDSIEIIDKSSLLFKGLPQYKTFTSNFYSGEDWANDGGRGHGSDWQKVMVADSVTLVGMIWNFVSGELLGSPISILKNPNSWSIFCGHTPVNQISRPDDYRFVYNMIICSSQPDLKTTVKNVFNFLPGNIDLKQNYPNPFNPVTTIEYQISKPALVKLQIFDLLGQQVRTLIDEPKSVGIHRTEWDGLNNVGKSVSSGVYIYRLIIGDHAQTKKMILLR